MEQNIQRFQNWLHKYESVVLEGFLDFGGQLPGSATRLPPIARARRNGGGSAPVPFLGAGAQAKVAAVLTDHPGIPAPDIAKLAGIPGNRVQAVLTRMRDNGSIRARGKRGRRTYALKTSKTAPAAANAT